MLARMTTSCSMVKMHWRNIALSVGPLVTSEEQTRRRVGRYDDNEETHCKVPRKIFMFSDDAFWQL